MSREPGVTDVPPAGPEQRCVRSGYWVIEGWDVRRVGPAKRPLYWRGTLGDQEFQIATLELARYKIQGMDPAAG